MGSPAHASLDNTYACSVPAGYTYDAVSYGYNQCSPETGMKAFVYRIRLPQHGMLACVVPPGWAQNGSSYGYNNCAPETGMKAWIYSLA